jgi:hypothetical protein
MRAVRWRAGIWRCAHWRVQLFVSVCCTGKSAASGLSSCAACAVGTVAPSAGTGSCQQCAAGRYQNATGQTACHLCDAGEFSMHQSVAVTRTGPTFAAPLTCLTHLSCIALLRSLADSGRSNAALGSAACTSCAAGKFSSDAGTADCSPCAPGQYQGGTGQTVCQLCSAGECSRRTAITDLLVLTFTIRTRGQN